MQSPSKTGSRTDAKRKQNDGCVYSKERGRGRERERESDGSLFKRRTTNDNEVGVCQRLSIKERE
jgi:hypothetical protein